jgi:hypothetical protein
VIADSRAAAGTQQVKQVSHALDSCSSSLMIIMRGRCGWLAPLAASSMLSLHRMLVRQAISTLFLRSVKQMHSTQHSAKDCCKQEETRRAACFNTVLLHCCRRLLALRQEFLPGGARASEQAEREAAAKARLR